MKLFKTLSEQDKKEYQQWARDNHKPFSPISGVWHSIVQAECTLMNSEYSFKQN